MEGISLAAGVKLTLLSLQQVDQKVRRTTERLASGKRVNSPLDDPTNYFVANSLRSAAADIDQLHHTIASGVSILQATANALERVTAMLQTMKGLLDAAAATSNPAQKKSLAGSFDEAYAQLNGIVRDAGYGGVNLISNISSDPLNVVSQDLSIPLNAQGSSQCLVEGSFLGSGYILRETPGGEPAWVSDDRGRFLTGYGAGVGNVSDIALVIRMNPQSDTDGDLNNDGLLQGAEGTEIDFRLKNSGTDTATGIRFSNATLSTGWGFAANTFADLGDVLPGSSVITDSTSDLDLNLPPGTDGTQFSITVDVTSDGTTKTLTFGPLRVGSITNGMVVSASVPATATATLALGSADYENGIFGVQFPGPPPEYKTLYAEKQGLKLYHSWVYEGFRTEAGIEAVRRDLNSAVDTVRSYASQIGSSNMVLVVRDQFNCTMSDTFVTGADNLTLADMNEESANMLMLQTRQQLGTSALGMASATSQAVIKMLE